MYCTQCGNQCEPGDRFCIECGTPLMEQQLPPGAKETRKGRIWVPIVVMIVMMAIGIGAFFAFRGYSDPETPWFTLRNGVLYFEANAYDGGQKLTVPATIDGHEVKQISDYCFSAAEGITEIHLPEGVEYIGSFAFSQAPNLQAVKLPESVVELGDGVFYGCVELEAVYIPGTVEYIGYETFVECSNLKHVFFGGTGEQWEAFLMEPLPENAKLYLVDGDNYKEYFTP